LTGMLPAFEVGRGGVRASGEDPVGRFGLIRDGAWG